MRLHTGVVLVAARDDPERETGVVVKDRQRRAISVIGQPELAREVDLPKVVGFGTFKGSPRSRLGRTGITDASVSTETRVDGARARNVNPWLDRPRFRWASDRGLDSALGGSSYRDTCVR